MVTGTHLSWHDDDDDDDANNNNNNKHYRTLLSQLHFICRTALVKEETFFSVALRPNAGHGLLILEVSSSHTTTHHSQ